MLYDKALGDGAATLGRPSPLPPGPTLPFSLYADNLQSTK